MQQKVTQSPNNSQQPAIYQTVWRWHFYAGIFVIPFLIILSLTGIVMLYDQQIQNFRFDGKLTIEVLPQQQRLSAVEQLDLISKNYPDGKVVKYLPARQLDQANFFSMVLKDKTLQVALNPYSGEVLQVIDRDDSWYALANDIHGSLLLGDWGDRVIETATGFIILLIASGLFLWLSARRSKSIVFIPTIRKGKRVFFNQLHSSIGIYTLLFLILFVVSGLSWSGVWGAKLVQAWNSFPAEKWGDIPLSDDTHASLNQGVMEEIPWNLEQTKLPLSQATASHNNAAQVDLNTIVEIAKTLTMQQYQINLPSGPKAVYTLSADTMSGDVSDPRLDRTVHIDQYSGAVLVDTGWSEYSLMAKFMAAGIGLHQGDLGWVNLLVNTLLCLLYILICLTGIYMWWQRKPIKSQQSSGVSLNAPKAISHSKRWYQGMVAVVLIGALLPLTGFAIVIVLLLDFVFHLSKSCYARYR